jgi:hypothetical protein
VSSARSRLIVAVRSSIHPWRTRCSASTATLLALLGAETSLD